MKKLTAAAAAAALAAGIDEGATVSPPRRFFRGISVVVDPLPIVAEAAATAIVWHVAGLPNPLLATAFVVMFLAGAGTYRRRLTLAGLDVVPRVAGAAAIGGVLAGVVSGGGVIVTGLLVAGLAACVAALAGRFLAYAVERHLRRSGLFGRRTVVVGAGTLGSALTQRMLDEPGFGLQPVAVLDDAAVTDVVECADVAVRPLDGSLPQLLLGERIDTVVIAFPQIDEATLLKLIHECHRLDREVLLVPRLWQACAVSRSMDHIGAIPIRRVSDPMRHNPMWHVKLFGNRCVAAVALLAISPLLAVLAAAVKLSDTAAPVLFRQKRVGLDGGEFEMLKFRSMSPANEHESQTNWSISGDPRVSPLGKLLRATSLDELPQLWNIVRGDMVLVGPRPERPHFVEQFSSSVPGYSARHRVPVGLTGFAAIHGLSGDTSVAERARYDNFYITNWTFWLDIKIIVRTLWVLVLKFQRDRSPVRPAGESAHGSTPRFEVSEAEWLHSGALAS